MGAGQIGASVAPAVRTLAGLFVTLGQHRGAAPALITADGRSLGHDDFAALRAARVAQLRRAGLSVRDRVALALPQSADAAAVSLVVASACCAVPLNPSSTVSELREALLRTRATWLVAAPDSLAWQCGQGLGLACVPVAPRRGGGFEFSDLPQRPAAPDQEPGAQDVAFLIQTSGSTAAPKLVPLTHRQLLRSAANLGASLSLGPEDRALAMLPLFHVGGLVDLLLAPLAAGGSAVVADTTASHAFFAALRAFDPTWYQAVPTMLREVVALARLDPHRVAGHRLRFIRAVSAELPARLQDELEAVFACPVVAIYGMTETAGVIASNPLPPGTAKPGSVGVSVGPEVRVRRADGSSAGPGESGEVCVRGETVIVAYEDADARCETDFDGDWLRTGDVGYLDAEGYLYLDGRLKDVINRGGEKVAPAEVDRCLLDHSEVVQAAAFGVPHPTLGEEVAAAVVLAPSSALDAAGVRGLLAGRLAAHKLPRHIHILDALPLGRTGKVDRRALAARYATAPAAPWQAPEKPSAQRVAQLWQRTLGVARVGLDDDFFDLGGDSLTAVACMLELQALSGIRLRAGVLYEHPTVRALCAYLDGLPQSAELAAFLDSPVVDGALAPLLYAQLQSHMHGWRGVRAHPHALIVGHRPDAPLTPLFWVVNAHSELIATTRFLDPRRPVYGMRSLFRLDGESDASRRALGEHLAREIGEIYPAGPVLLGGFCAGGRVALEVADALRARGRRVALLCLLDTRVHRAYAGDVLVLHTRRSGELVAGPHVDAGRGYQRYYLSRVCQRRLNVRHTEVLARHARRFTGVLDDALRRFEAGTLDWTPPPPGRLALLPDDACRAVIRCAEANGAPPRWRAGDVATLHVTLTNAGTVTWPRSADSGLVLAASVRRTRGPDTPTPRGRHVVDGWCELPETIAPGAGVTLDLPVRVPPNARECVVEVDLLDDGAAWLADRGSERCAVPVQVVGGQGGVRRAASAWTKKLKRWARR